MKKLTGIAASVGALMVSACATQPHSDASMLAGQHPMAPKQGMMSDKAMPGRSADCAQAALEKMPPDHRRMCEKGAAKTK